MCQHVGVNMATEYSTSNTYMCRYTHMHICSYAHTQALSLFLLLSLSLSLPPSLEGQLREGQETFSGALYTEQ